MNKIFLLLTLLVGFLKAGDLIINPGISAGMITACTSQSELIKKLGDENVKTTEVPVGEGESMTGTVIFSGNPEKRAYILWHNAKERKHPQYFIVLDNTSAWKTKEGIGMGTTLKSIEKLNGAPFRLYGFEWDDAGMVVSAGKGKLTYLGKNFTVSLEGDMTGKNIPADAYMKICGDTVFSSANATMQKLNPSVYKINMVFTDLR